ncbi:MAG: HEAT repeat domain-containing protein [Bacteroidota bacterium]
MKTIMVSLTFCFMQLFIETAFAQYNATQPTSIFNRPTEGQWLLRQGIDTSKADQIRSALINNSYAESVLEYLAERPDPQYTEDIVAFMKHHTEHWFTLATGKALLQLGDARGVSALDSLITKTIPDDSYYAHDKLEAIKAFASKGVYNYVDTLLSNYLFLIRTGLYGNSNFSTMQLYANRAKYHDRVFSTMINSYSSSMDYHVKDDIVFAVNEMNTQQGYEFLLNVLKTDTTYLTRAISLDCLRKKPTPEFLSYVFQAAQTEPNKYIRSQFLENLYWLGTPAAFFRLEQTIQTESEYYIRESTILLINHYKPNTPDPAVSVNTLIDSLASIEKQVIPFNWLGDNNFINVLDGYLTNAKNSFNAGNQIDCARQIRTFQQAVDREYRDSTNATPAFVTVEGWKFLYYNAQYILDRLPALTTDLIVKLVNSSGTNLIGGTLQYRDSTWENATNNNDGTFTIISTKKKLSLRMTYAYGTQTKSNVTIGSDTIIFQTKNVVVNLQNSQGNPLDTGVVQYNASGWQDFGTTSNGVVTKELLPTKYNFRMTYNGATVTKSQSLDSNSTVVFQTVSAIVKLQTSTGIPLDTGIVQFNASGWKDFGTTLNGAVTKELLPTKYNFRMTYNGATISKAQNIDSNATVVFQTVPANVQLQTSTGAPLDTGIVQFNAGGWKNFGTTLNGVVTKELLPTKYNFRITYDGATISKSQSIDSNLTVVFHTIPAIVQLLTSTGTPLDTGIVQYNSGGWRDFGITSNGVVTKELLPTKYNFRVTYDGATVSEAQSIDSNATVIFQTVKTLVQFNNSKGNPMPAPLGDTGIVQFNSGGWQNFGPTSNGVVTKELLPVKYTFRLTYCGSSVSIAQNVDSSATVVFSTVLCTVSVTNTAGSFLNNATVSYNAGGWKLIGTTVNGIVTIELLPVKIQFRAAYGSKQQSVTQDVSTNPFIAITLPVQ